MSSSISIDALIDAARTAGEEHGRNAGSWVIDGNTSAATARAILRGIEDGDPETLDALPSSPLSGEWADDPTPATVLADLETAFRTAGAADLADEVYALGCAGGDDDTAGEILTAYEEGFAAGVVDEVERAARAILPDDRVSLEIIDGPDAQRDADGWEHYAYTVELSRDGVSLRVPWRQGLGVTDAPTAAGVLECLLMDAATIENADGFESWADELGFDTDSRRAEAIYRQAVEQTERLRDLLGDDYTAAVFPADDHDAAAARLAGGSSDDED